MAQDENLYTTHPDIVVLYAAAWCPDCDRVRSVIEQSGVEFLEVDVAKDARAGEFLEKLLRRVRLPTIFFPDGGMSVEPSNEEVARHLPHRSASSRNLPGD